MIGPPSLAARPSRPTGRPLRRAVAALVVALVGVLVVAGCGSGSSGGDEASAVSLLGVQRNPPLQVGDVSLPEVARDPATSPAPDGRFTFRADPGSLLVVYFGFTSCPDVCPTTLADLRTAREEVGAAAADLPLAMVTVDPARDTPERLDGYLAAFADRYRGLRTDDPAELAAAEQAFGARSSVTTGPDGEPVVNHTAVTYVVDDTGEVLVEWTFGTTPQDMASDLRALLADVSGAP